jgi:hypothetical protein
MGIFMVQGATAGIIGTLAGCALGRLVGEVGAQLFPGALASPGRCPAASNASSKAAMPVTSMVSMT